MEAFEKVLEMLLNLTSNEIGKNIPFHWINSDQPAWEISKEKPFSGINRIFLKGGESYLSLNYLKKLSESGMTFEVDDSLLYFEPAFSYFKDTNGKWEFKSYNVFSANQVPGYNRLYDKKVRSPELLLKKTKEFAERSEIEIIQVDGKSKMYFDGKKLIIPEKKHFSYGFLENILKKILEASREYIQNNFKNGKNFDEHSMRIAVEMLLSDHGMTENRNIRSEEDKRYLKKTIDSLYGIDALKNTKKIVNASFLAQKIADEVNKN